MTEMVNGMSQSFEGDSQPVTSSAPISQPAASSDEKTFRQSEVTDIVRRERQEAVDRHVRMSLEQPQRVQQKYPELAQQHSQPISQPQQASFTADDVRRMAAEESQRLRDEWISDTQRKSQEQDAQRVVSEFFTKLSTGKEKYSDFDSVAGDIDFGRFPNAIQLANGYIDNTSDVVYELGKNRSKLANIENLAKMSPRDAIVEIKRLSQSIKDNQTASNMRIPNAPLSQLRPSNTGTGSGDLSVKDLRAKYRA